MHWEFRAGQTGAGVLRVLDSVLERMANVTPGPVYDVILQKYLEWARITRIHLGGVIDGDQASRLVYTPAYWAACGMANQHLLSPPGLVFAEIEERRDQLTRLRQELARDVEFWSKQVPALVVADTCVGVEHAESLDQIDWHGISLQKAEIVVVVVPLVVIDELDGLKRNNNMKAGARRSLKTLAALDLRPQEVKTLRAGSPSRVDIAFLAEDPRRPRLPIADDEIVAQVAYLGALAGCAPTLVTFDTGMELRAKTANVPCVLLPDEDRGDADKAK